MKGFDPLAAIKEEYENGIMEDERKGRRVKKSANFAEYNSRLSSAEFERLDLFPKLLIDYIFLKTFV